MTSHGAAGTPPPGALAERLGTATSRLNALLRHHLAQAEITISQARTLGTLATRGPQRITELALIEQVAQPTMSVLLTRLDEHGLIERRADPANPKATLVSINKAGLELWRSIVALRTNLFGAGLTLLSASERKSLEAALPALEHLVDQLQGSGAEQHARR
ncbi:MAG: MarR family transcriptional regulator [Candidatus Dormibacteraeota bacterium]|nr:MarR family transcriptional regulator [Candidatus Dormibacteraeota bacterium]